MCEPNADEVLDLKRTALNIRKKILRMIKTGKSGHIGGAMSCVDVLTALYFRIMRIDPNNPGWRERDRFVLSAGHKCLALYAALAERGFFGESLLDTYNHLGTRLPGHPDMHRAPGIEASTGALGHGLSVAGGMAMAAKMDGLDYRVYVITGDGEIEEGSIWEAAAAASHHRLDNLVVFVDRNRLQISGPTRQVMNYEPLDRRWEAFGWTVREVDGHDMSAILKISADIPFEKDRPSVIIANTVKSKGLSFAENKAEYHQWKPTPEELEKAQRDLDRIGRELAL
ncbi:MAG: transketolase [Deltaproteobacteria bacterium]|nr:transketolase [Deltaproteobacteria bacterium]